MTEVTKWEPGKPTPVVWYTTGYRWMGQEVVWARTAGGIREERVIRYPQRQTVRPRSKYIPAGPHRNVT